MTDEKNDDIAVVEVATDRTAEANRTCSWVDYAAVHDVLVRLIHVGECCSCCKLNAACSCPVRNIHESPPDLPAILIDDGCQVDREVLDLSHALSCRRRDDKLRSSLRTRSRRE